MTTLVILAALCVPCVPQQARSCVIDQPPKPAAKRVAAAACHRPAKPLAADLTAAITNGFIVEHDGGKAEVKFPCDGLGAKIAEIVIETGSGHGGSLELWRAKRRADGDYDVRGIVYRGHAMTHQATNPPHLQASGVVSLPELDRARAAMTAKIREVVPPAPPGTALGMSSSFSSNDFHVLVRMTDDAGRVVERTYTGYETSSDQAKFLGLQVAAEALAPITTLTANIATFDADDQALFVERFNAAVPHFGDDFYWWVMERQVDLARFLGNAKTLGGLLTRMTVPANANRSAVDARVNAVDAIAKITGWDARDGGKSVEEAAAAYLTSCH